MDFCGKKVYNGEVKRKKSEDDRKLYGYQQ